MRLQNLSAHFLRFKGKKTDAAGGGRLALGLFSTAERQMSESAVFLFEYGRRASVCLHEAAAEGGEGVES